MKDVPNKELLKESSVLEEISRHRWIESEKAGYDVGQEWAENDWLIHYSKDWKVYHSSTKKKTVKKGSAKPVVIKTVQKVKKRSAKAY